MSLHLGIAFALPAAPQPAAEKPTLPVWFDTSVSVPADTVGSAGRLLEGRTDGPGASSSLAAPSPARPRPAHVRRQRSGDRPPEAAVNAACGTHDPRANLAGAGGHAPGTEELGSAGGAPGAAGAHGAQLGGATSRAHGPGLLVQGSPCAGYFPAGAESDLGEVQIAVDVDLQGHARGSAVLLEQPRGQGFASAARACAARLQFAPAVDAGGAVVPGQAKLKLRFRRPSMS